MMKLSLNNLDIIENQVLDGKSFDETSKDNNLKILRLIKLMQKKKIKIKIK